MDKYYEMAAEYFQKVEGRHLYPKLFSLYWLAWSVTIIGFAYLFGSFILSIFTEDTPPSIWWMFGFEVAFLLSVVAIQVHKQYKLLEGEADAPIQKTKFKLVKTKHLRVKHLTTATGKTPDQYAATAKEISDLMAFEKASRTIFDIEFRDVIRALYDPESKARILSLLLALAALLVTLLKGSEVAPLADLIPEIEKKGGIAIFSVVALVRGALYFSAIGCAYVAINQVFFVLTFWLSKFSWSKAGNRTMLNHMLRDLVMSYDPTAKPKVEPVTSTEQSTPTEAKPANPAAPIASLPTLAAGVLLGGLASLMWDRKDDKQ